MRIILVLSMFLLVACNMEVDVQINGEKNEELAQSWMDHLLISGDLDAASELMHEDFTFMWMGIVYPGSEIHGKESVSSISLKDTSDDSSSELNIDGVFMAIGHTPNVTFLNGLVDLDEKGYIKTGFTTDTSTSVPGIFAAGDVADSVYRQAVTAAGTGCQAAIDAERWLDH